MKYKIIYIAAAIAAMTVSCNKQEGVVISDSEQPTGTVRTERIGLVLADNPNTKVNVDGTTGAITWIENTDQIAVCIKTNTSYAYRTCPVNGDSSIEVDLANSQTRDLYAIYPATSAVTNYDGKSNTYPLRIQYPSSYDLSSFTTLEAIANYCPSPMVAINDGSEVLRFYHVGGVLRLKIDNAPKGTVSMKIILNGSNVQVTGTFRVYDGGTASTTISNISSAATQLTYTFSSTLFAESSGDLTLNIPLPATTNASFSGYKIVFYDSDGIAMGASEYSFDVAWGNTERTTGRKFSLDYATDKNIWTFSGYRVTKGWNTVNSTDPFALLSNYGSKSGYISAGGATPPSGWSGLEHSQWTNFLSATSGRPGATVNGESGKFWSDIDVDLTGSIYANKGINNNATTRGNYTYARLLYPDGETIVQPKLTSFQSYSTKCSLTYSEVMDLVNNHGCAVFPAVGGYHESYNTKSQLQSQTPLQGGTLYMWTYNSSNNVYYLSLNFSSGSFTQSYSGRYDGTSNSLWRANLYYLPSRYVQLQ